MNKIEELRIKEVKETFLNTFHHECDFVIKSCGRLEILGNHTEYSSGLVINASTDNLSIFAAASKSNDDKIHIISKGYKDLLVDIHQLEYNPLLDNESSEGLVKGVLKYFLSHDFNIGGLEVVINSTIFKGAGVSSSASYAVLVGKLLSYFYNNNEIEHVRLALCSKWAENNYFGKNSGIQDALGSVSNGMEILDCKDQHNPIITHFDADLKDYSILLINSLCSHDNSEATEAFNSIPADYKYIANLYGERYLRFIPKDDFLKEFNKEENNSKRAYKRAYHYINELDRVEKAYDSLIKGDFNTFFKQFNESGLSNEFILCNVTLPSEETNSMKEVLDYGRSIIKDGAIRVHGGGFGGCCIAIINNNEKESFIEKMAKLVGKDNIVEVTISNEPLKIYK